MKNGKEQEYAREHIKDEVLERADAGIKEKDPQKNGYAIKKSMEVMEMHQKQHKEEQKKAYEQWNRIEEKINNLEDSQPASLMDKMKDSKNLVWLIVGVLLTLLIQGEVSLQAITNLV